MVDLVYCLTNLLFFDIQLLYYYKWCYIISNFLPLFWRYISFFWYFFIILIFDCLWIILLQIFLNFRDFISNFITNQITKCYCCFLNYSFEEVVSTSAADCLALSRSFWRITNTPGLYLPLTNIFTYTFIVKIHSLLQIFHF